MEETLEQIKERLIKQADELKKAQEESKLKDELIAKKDEELKNIKAINQRYYEKITQTVPVNENKNTGKKSDFKDDDELIKGFIKS